MPEAVRRALEVDGVLGPVRGRPRVDRCGRCGVCVWLAVAGGWPPCMGPVVEADVVPVTEAGEAWALLGGLETFDWWPDALVPRVHVRGLAGRLAGVPVVVAHRCGVSWEADHAGTRRMFPPSGGALVGDLPPF